MRNRQRKRSCSDGSRYRSGSDATHPDDNNNSLLSAPNNSDASVINSVKATEDLLHLVLSSKDLMDSRGNSFLHACRNNNSLGQMQILLDRVKQMDEYNNNNEDTSHTWQFKFLTQPDQESGYTPLHSAIYNRQLAPILLLLRQAVNTDTHTTSTAGIHHEPYRFIQHPRQIMQNQQQEQPQQQQKAGTLLTPSSAIVSASDNEGMTPLQLLEQLQCKQLRLCRLSLLSPGILQEEQQYAQQEQPQAQEQEQQGRQRRGSFDDLDQMVDEQNEYDILSRGLDYLPRDEGVSSTTKEERSNFSNWMMYGCEVCTFGRANHLALGVSQSAATTSSATIDNTDGNKSDNKFCPQRVQAFAQDTVGRTNTALSVAAAPHHTLVLTKLGHVYSFGLGKGGRLGLGDENHYPMPTRVVGGSLRSKVVISIAAAENHSLCATTTGQVFAWGSNRFGQLGFAGGGGINATTSKKNNEKKINNNSSSNNSSIDGGSRCCAPHRVDDLKGVNCIKVAAGTRHSVALSNIGEVYVWGDNTSGQLGTGFRRGVGSASSGSNGGGGNGTGSIHKVHRVQALWGKDRNDNYYNNSQNRKVAIDIAASEFSTLVLTKAYANIGLPVNSIYSWGHGNHVPCKVNFENLRSNRNNNDKNSNSNDYGGYYLSCSRPINPIAITCAKYHNAAITSDGRVYIWGLHAESLGCSTSKKSAASPSKTNPADATATTTTTTATATATKTITSPQLVTGMLPENGGGRAVSIDACENHTAVVTDCGSLFTWGATYGKDVLGHVGVRYQPRPKKVPGIYRAVNVAVAKEHTVLLVGTVFPPINQIIPKEVKRNHDKVFGEKEELSTTQEQHHQAKGNTSTTAANRRICSLEVLAARKVAEHVDLFNVVPILITAERCQSSHLIQYCTQFIHHNLDGVINLCRKSEMDCYLNEQLHDCYYYNYGNEKSENINSESSSFYYYNNDDNDDDDSNPLIQDIILAGSGNSSSSGCNSKQKLVDFVAWAKACEKLSQTSLVKTLSKRYYQQKEEEESTTFQKKKKNSRSARSVSFGGEKEISPAGSTACSERCLMLTSNMDLSSKDFVVAKHECLSKEMRGVRKRLNQITKLIESTSLRSAGESPSTPTSSSLDFKGDEISTLSLSAEQREKIARRPQLLSDLMQLERAFENVQQRMRELNLGNNTTASSLPFPLKEHPPESDPDGVGVPSKDKLDNRKTQEIRFAASSTEIDKKTGNGLEGSATLAFRCKVCSVTCPDEKSYTLHVNGRKHRNRVAQVEDEEKKQAAVLMMQEQHRQQVLDKKVQPSKNAQLSANTVSSPPKNPWNKTNNANTSGSGGYPRYKLPPPPLPVSDVIESPKVNKYCSSKKDDNSKSKSKGNVSVSSNLHADTPNFRQILEEEAKTVSTPRGGKLLVGSNSKGHVYPPLELPPGSAPALKSPPWVKKTAPTTPVKTPWLSSGNANPAAASIRSSTVKVSPSIVGDNRYNLGDFLDVTKKQQHRQQQLPVTPKSKKAAWSVAQPVSASPLSSQKISGRIDVNLSQGLPSSPAGGAVAHPRATSSPSATKTVLSLREIQEEEESFKDRQDQSCGVVNGKWFIHRQERAESFHMIQEGEEKEREHRLMVEEQMRIEKQIEQDMLRKQREENAKGNKKKYKKKKKATGGGGKAEEQSDGKANSKNKNRSRQRNKKGNGTQKGKKGEVSTESVPQDELVGQADGDRQNEVGTVADAAT